MICELPSSTTTLGLPRMGLSARHLVQTPDPGVSSAHDLLNDITNIAHRSPTTTSVNSTCMDGLSLRLSRFQPTNPFRRVVTVDRHDKDAWIREWEMHDTTLDAVAASSSPCSNSLDDYLSVDITGKGGSFASMEFQNEKLWAIEQFPNSARFGEDTPSHADDWVPFVAPVSCVSPVSHCLATHPYSYEDLCEGRRRVGDILTRCGVIESEVAPIDFHAVECGDTSGAHLVSPIISSVTAKLPFHGNDLLLVTALAEWTSEWIHNLILRPYLQGGFCFRYQGKQNKTSVSVALRIRRVLSDVENPVQVAIHALWFIGNLAGNDVHGNPSFLSVPIFQYLHNNGTFFAEDYMFRTFVACAMIGDKAVNDATLSTNTWNRLTRIPQAILNATEKYALGCLKWNVSMTQIQWQDIITYLRSCIKMGSAFDPFAYGGTSPSTIMARCLDGLINLSHEHETYTSQQETFVVDILAPQPIRPFKHSEIFDMDWCPRHDPVINQKPRTIGIAPGADQNPITYMVGMTGKDLPDSITGSSNVLGLAHFVPSAGTSFCGSFGVIGVRLAHTIKVAGTTCKSASWVPSHG